MSLLLIFLTWIAGHGQDAFAADAPQACRRFRVHLGAELPAPPPTVGSKTPLPAGLRAAISEWESALEFLRDPRQKEKWLECIRPFLALDTDHDGTPDWTAVVDGRPSQVLFPLDPDIDGDGTENVLDENPYAASAPARVAGSLPEYLKIKGEASLWQAKLWSDFRVLAVDHTDAHRGQVLKSLYTVLNSPLFRSWAGRQSAFHTIYAFGSHDPHQRIAAYHPTAKAVSVAGRLSYQEGLLTAAQECQVRSALVHEIGHAVLFASVRPDDLRANAIRFGKWSLPAPLKDLWNPAWLNSARITGAPASVSDYAATNVHEWFAENFAAYVFGKARDKNCQPFAHPNMAAQLKSWFDRLMN